MRRSLIVALLAAAILPAEAQDVPIPGDPVTDNQGDSIGFTYRVESEISVPVLKDGVTLLHWVSRFSVHFTRYTLRVDGQVVRVGSVRQLRPYLRDIADATTAYKYLTFIRAFYIPLALDDETAYSQLLTFGEPRYGGRYSEEDAVRWRVGREPEVVVEPNRFVFRQPAIVWRVTDFAADPERRPWRGLKYEPVGRIVLLEETVTSSGDYSARTIRVLQDTRDVDRYIRRTPW